MSLFTVNRYLGEPSPQASNTNHAQSILDRLNAKARAKEEQRKTTNRASAAVSPASPAVTNEAALQKGEISSASAKKSTKPGAHASSCKELTPKSKKKSKVKGLSDSDSKKGGSESFKGKDEVKRTNTEAEGGAMSSGDRIGADIDTVGKRTEVDEVDGTNYGSKQSSNTPKKRKKKRKNEVEEVVGIESAELEHSDLQPSDEVDGSKADNLEMEKSPRKKMRTKPKTRSKEPVEVCDNLEEDKKDVDEEMSVAMEMDELAEEEEEESDDETKEGNFKVLGNFEKRSKKKVQETLPDWLAKPSIIKKSLTEGSVMLESIKGLDARLVATLTSMGIAKLFPVQHHVIPVIMDSLRHGMHAGIAGFRPRDVCISAPTGSGKTLAYAIPVIQALIDRVVPRVRALVVLPTRDLATQVHKVMTRLCGATPLKVVLVGGAKKFAQEQAQLVKESDGEYHSLADIVIATPGRLVDNINHTPGFTLQHLRFLVIDEADRMMDQITQDWISQVERSAYSTDTPVSHNGLARFQHSVHRPKPGPLTVARSSAYHLPLQKLLFSATLSQNPEKLTQLRLFQPRLITTATGFRPPTPASSARRTDGGSEGSRGAEMEEEEREEDEGMDVEEGRNEFVGKYTTPVGLSEYFVQCTAGEKPLVLQHLLSHLHFKQVLCFTNTVQATHRLYVLLKLMGGVEAAEFSSNLHQSERQNILRQFKAGKIQILVCSDAMTRGMDIENVKCVISYDLPPHLKTYIHRVGRTARAGRGGTAFSLIRKKEVTKLKQMLRNAGKEGIKRHHVAAAQLESFVPSYTDALAELSAVLKDEKAHQY